MSQGTELSASQSLDSSTSQSPKSSARQGPEQATARQSPKSSARQSSEPSAIRNLELSAGLVIATEIPTGSGQEPQQLPVAEIGGLPCGVPPVKKTRIFDFFMQLVGSDLEFSP